MAEQPYPLAYVEWKDSGGRAGGLWQEIADLDHKTIACTSVGWLLYEDDTVISLASHITNAGQDHALHLASGTMTIPRAAITKMWILVE